MGYLRKKILFYLIAVWAALTLNFLIPRLAPGNPVDAILARQQQVAPVPPEARRSLELLLGVSDEPLWRQYIDYLQQIFTGDLGRTVTYFPTPVTQVIGDTLPWTLCLIGISTALSFLIGITLGAIAGWYRGSKLDILVPSTTMLAAIPYFWLALIFVFVFAFKLGWFPLAQGYDVYHTQPGWNWPFIQSAIYHGTLPAITIIVSSIAGWLLGMRNMMVSTLGEDYVLTAEAKGLPTRRVMISYAARNAVLPSVAGVAISLGFVVSGSIVTEAVFSYPGIGYTLLQAVQNADYPLMQGIFLIITLSVLGANFIVDVLYAFIDPRARVQS